MASAQASSFPKFLNLPVEIQAAIWKLVPNRPVPEVCILSPANISRYSDQPAGPLIVDTAWPALLHVLPSLS